MKRIAVLGATGSIGESTFKVVRQFPDRFRIVALAASGRKPDRLAQQVRETGARLVAVAGREEAEILGGMLGSDVEVLWGTEGLVRVASDPDLDLVVSAIVGAAGLVPTYAALLCGHDVAVANKETLVAGGELVMEAARATGARILPVDSEHSALFQVLDGKDTAEVRRMILTASGGPFHGWDLQRLESAGIEQALAHPNWSMGPKITIDSATLMNKGLEVIEARWLFGIETERIEVIIHPQSVVHSIVEFVDGSMLAQLGVPDMRGPISYALHYPSRLPMPDLELDLSTLAGLHFSPPDHRAFPCLRLAYDALDLGGTAPAVLSAANEIAVEAFLQGRLRFTEIPAVLEAALDAHTVGALDSVQTALKADRWAREQARDWLDGRRGRIN